MQDDAWDAWRALKRHVAHVRAAVAPAQLAAALSHVLLGEAAKPLPPVKVRAGRPPGAGAAPKGRRFRARSRRRVRLVRGKGRGVSD